MLQEIPLSSSLKEIFLPYYSYPKSSWTIKHLSMTHDKAKRETMQRGNWWFFEPTEQEVAFPESSMTFSPNMPSFHRMTQGKGISINLKVKGVLVWGCLKDKTEVLFTFKSCCNFLLNYSTGSGWRRSQDSTQDRKKKKASVRTPRPRVGKGNELCQLSRIKRNKPGLHPEPSRSLGLPSEVLYHLSSHFLFMLLKKKQTTTKNTSCCFSLDTLSVG